MEGKPISLGVEKMRRRYLPEMIQRLESILGEDTDDEKSLVPMIEKAKQAIKELKEGKTQKAIELIDQDIENLEGWKTLSAMSHDYKINTEDLDRRINELKTLKQDLEEYGD